MYFFHCLSSSKSVTMICFKAYAIVQQKKKFFFCCSVFVCSVAARSDSVQLRFRILLQFVLFDYFRFWRLRMDSMRFFFKKKKKKKNLFSIKHTFDLNDSSIWLMFDLSVPWTQFSSFFSFFFLVFLKKRRVV